MKKIFITYISSLVLGSLFLAACGRSAYSSGSPSAIHIVASTTIIGDVVRQIAGEDAELTVLIPVGSDPHTFDPRPQDIAALSQADVVFINGFELEEALMPALQANVQGLLVTVSDGIKALVSSGEDKSNNHEDHEADQSQKDAEEHEAHEHSAGDPHTWMDPNNVIVWSQNIAKALSQVDPQNGDKYQRNAEAYIADLRELDRWIRDQVAQIPPAQRKLVTDHASFGYFAEEYGFTLVGLVIPSLSTNAAPSAQELATLVDEVREQGVKAIFVGTTVNPSLSKQVAADTGAQIVFVYTGSLSEPGKEADSYLKFMRYNVSAIVAALK